MSMVKANDKAQNDIFAKIQAPSNLVPVQSMQMNSAGQITPGPVVYQSLSTMQQPQMSQMPQMPQMQMNMQPSMGMAGMPCFNANMSTKCANTNCTNCYNR